MNKKAKNRYLKTTAIIGLSLATTFSSSVIAFADTAPIETINYESINWDNKAISSSINDIVNIRSGPGTNCSRTGVLLPGGIVNIINTSNGWDKIQSGNVEGYIKSDLLVHGNTAQALFDEVNSKDIAGVNAETINLRSDASMDDNIIGMINGGEILEVKSRNNGWCEIEYDGIIGYISEEFLKNIDGKEALTLTEYGLEFEGADTDPSSGVYVEPVSSIEELPTADEIVSANNVLIAESVIPGTEPIIDTPVIEEPVIDYIEPVTTDNSETYVEETPYEETYVEPTYSEEYNYTEEYTAPETYAEESYDYTEEYTEPEYVEPTYEESVDYSYEEPTYEEPVYEEPVSEEPVYEEPVYEEPTYEEEYVEPTYETPSVSQSDVDLLAAIIQCEAGGEIRDGKVAVGACVLNRVNSDSFPDTISDVLYEDWQFTPAMTGLLDQTLAEGAREDCYEAAYAALNGENPIGDLLFFHAGDGEGLTIGNQTFY